MCGRFTLSEEVFILQKTYEFYYHDESDMPRYNIAPGQEILVIVEEQGEKIGRKLKWGFVPSWANENKRHTPMINARAETIESKPSFKQSFRNRRCLVLANGYYEWQKQGGGKKQPYYFALRNNQPFVMAGIWNEKMNGEERIATCCIVTTAANELMSSVHHRMPVMLTKNNSDKWLYSSEMDELKSLCHPYQSKDMQMYKVSDRVNSVKNDSPELLNSL